MPTDKPSPAIGSEAWLGADELESGSEMHSRATNFFATVNWDALTIIASQRRNGVPSSFIGSFSIGHFNMTQRLGFEDGVSWVARLRLPTDGDAADYEALETSKVMEIEVASMKFFRSKTCIPVPEVHAYDFSADNKPGAPFILMDYIHGSVASELRSTNGSSTGLFGTPEQDRKFREQMARIQATVASFRFPNIGGIYYNEDTDDFFIGPELQTGKGPWASSTEYYDDVTIHSLKATTKHDTQESPACLLPPALNFLQRICGEEKTGPFRLTNRDFGAHNVLVNQDFDIVGVIDFDGVMAAPIEVVAQYPAHAFLEVEPPGVVDSRPAVVERVARTIPRLQAYKEMLARCEEGDEDGGIKVSARLASKSASVYQGLMAYRQHQDFVNDEWIKSCFKMLQGQTQSQN